MLADNKCLAKCLVKENGDSPCYLFTYLHTTYLFIGGQRTGHRQHSERGRVHVSRWTELRDGGRAQHAEDGRSGRGRHVHRA